MITTAIIDDHPIVRAGMRSVLDAAPDVAVVAEGANGHEALRLVQEQRPDVLVLDFNLPGLNGLEVTRRLCARGAPPAILILTVHDDAETVMGLLESGATGYVLKDEALETLVCAVRAAARGESWLSPSVANEVVRRAVASPGLPAGPRPGHRDYERLTPREHQVLCLLARGLENAAIARQLVVTRRTVQNHVSNIYGKLGVGSRTEAALVAISRGWVEVPPEEAAPGER
jgi:DNA-binding NarL/FixJ family response regulator